MPTSSSSTRIGVLYVRLDPSTKRAVEAIAKREERTQNAVVRRILRDHFATSPLGKTAIQPEVSHAG